MKACKPGRSSGGSGPAYSAPASGRMMARMQMLLGLAAVIAAAGSLGAAEAHFTHETVYYDIVLDVTDYERTEYNGFDLVRMNVAIENLAGFEMVSPMFVLGGAAEYVDDPLINPDTDIKPSYAHSSYIDVRTRGGDVRVEECASVDRFGSIPHAETGETSLCFMIGKYSVPDGLLVNYTIPLPDHWVYSARDGDYWFDRAHRHHIGQCASSDHGTHDHSYNSGIRNTHACYDSHYTQVIPFHDDSVFCFDLNFEWCNADNIQDVSGAPTPKPEPDLPADAALLYTIYNNHTGALTLIFDQPVVARNPDRIGLIHDIEAFIEDGTALGLGDAELTTVDNKRQSTILVFMLADETLQQVTEALRTHGDLALVVQSRAVYSADGFTDVTEHTDAGAILVGDLTVIR